VNIVGADFGKSVRIHDLAVTSVRPPAVYRRTGEIVNINATIANLGGFIETSQVSLFIGSTSVNVQSVTLAPGTSTTLTLTWNSTGQNPAIYPISVRVSLANGEFLTSNNVLNSTLPLTFRGDVNRDGKGNILDVNIVNSRFGTSSSSPNYLADADVNHDGYINILDVNIVGADFGKSLT